MRETFWWRNSWKWTNSFKDTGRDGRAKLRWILGRWVVRKQTRHFSGSHFMTRSWMFRLFPLPDTYNPVAFRSIWSALWVVPPPRKTDVMTVFSCFLFTLLLLYFDLIMRLSACRGSQSFTFGRFQISAKRMTVSCSYPVHSDKY